MSQQEVDLNLLLDPGDQLDLAKLAESALKSFALMKRWYQAKGLINHTLVARAIDRVTDQTDVYRLAITLSLETARDGCILAGDAFCLCGHISAGTASVKVLGQFAQGMLDLAKTAEERARKMQEQFRAVRRALHEISRDILFYAVEIQKDTSCNDQQGFSPANSGDTAFVLLPVSHGVNISNSTVEENIEGSKSRSTEQMSVTSTMTELHQVHLDLTELVDYVGGFVDWWGQMKAKLLTLCEKIPMMSVDGSNLFRTVTVHSSWISVKEQYTLYQIRISAIQDYHHHMLLGDRPINLDTANILSMASSQSSLPASPERHRQYDAKHTGHAFLRLVRGAVGSRKSSGS